MIRRHRRRGAGRLWVFCDGGLGAQPIPMPILPSQQRGPIEIHAGCGALARNDGGVVVDWAWRGLPTMTNNEAEYAGLLLGVELAQRHTPGHVVFVLDSEVVVGQMQGRFAVNSPGLRQWHMRARRAVQTLARVDFCLVPRACNALADALAHEAGLPWDRLHRGLMAMLPEAEDSLWASDGGQHRKSHRWMRHHRCVRRAIDAAGLW